MSKHCEFCNAEKDTMTTELSFTNNPFTADLYSCGCPKFICDELLFMRSNNIRFIQDDWEKLRGLFKQKKDFTSNRMYKNVKYNDELHKSVWNYYDNLVNLTDKQKDSLSPDIMADINIFKNIKDNIWRILYKYKKED